MLPNSTLTMARHPALMKAFAALNATIMGEGQVSTGLKQMVASVVSNSAGCRYCHAHTSHVATRRGVDETKVGALWEFETSPLFSPGERAALRVARGAGVAPNAVTDEDMETLRSHYNDEQVVEIVAVIANFGFLNRWNDTMATQLEQSPLNWAQEHLSPQGWQPGKHA